MRRAAPKIASAAELPQEAAPLRGETGATTAGDRAAEALRCQHRFIALTGESHAEKGAIIAAVLKNPDFRAICVANPLTAPLTLSRIAFQIGGADMLADAEDAALSLGTALAHGGCGSPVVLVIQDAETLDDEALLWLQRLPAIPDTEHALQSILFVGSPAFHAVVQDDRFASLRDTLVEVTVDAAPAPGALSQTELVSIPLALPQPAIFRGNAPGVALARIRRAGFPRLYWVIGYSAIGAAAVAATFVMLTDILHRNPGEPGAAAVAAPVEPQPVPQRAESPSATAIPPAAPAAPFAGDIAVDPAPIQAVERLRRDFDAFLDRAGQDTARLSATQRQALFREYLEWRRRSGAESGVPAP
jgi:hypothetical protein